MKKLMTTVNFWEVLLLLSIVYFFVDVFLLFGAFFITIPLTVIIAVIASVFAFKEKRYLYIVSNFLLAIVPIAAFLMIPW